MGSSPSRRSTALVVAISVLVGLVLAIVLVLGPAAGATEPVVTGSVLLAFGIGWFLLALLSVRYTDQPQRWAFVPGVSMSLVGVALVVGSPTPRVMNALSWLWPPALSVLVVWMALRIHRDLHGRGTWLLYPIVFVLGLIAIGGAFETLSAARDDATYRMPGQLVDVGGRKLYIECSGTGEPTVVFESGLAEGSPYWVRIASAVSKTTHVCVYDRAGRGPSDDAPGPQDGGAVARDLHALLADSGNAGPFILVGHSTGGPYIRAFAATYPDEVAGMVLLDAQPIDAFTALPTFPSFYSGIGLKAGLLPSLARIGIWRVLTAATPLDLPSPYREAEQAEQSTPRLLSAQRDEFAVLPATLAQGAALTTLGAKPLVVVTAGTDAQAGWAEAQDEMAALSSNSSHRVASDQTHTSLIVSEEGAALSARAIEDVIMSSRTGAALVD